MTELWTITVIFGAIASAVGVVYCYLERRRVLKYLGGINRYPEIPIMGSTHLIAFRNTESENWSYFVITIHWMEYEARNLD